MLRMNSCVLGALGLLALPAVATAQITVVNDTFEAGFFDSDWTTTTGSGTAVVFDAGDAAGGSDWYGHVEGITGSDGGLGVSLFDLDGGGGGAGDFTIDLDFRISPVETNARMFNLMVNGSSSTPTNSGSALNLRYTNDAWQVYNGSWTTIGLPSITPNTWHSLSVTGNSWGTGIAGTATYDIQLNGGTTLSGLQLFQNDADTLSAMSVSLNDRWSPPSIGFDVDDVTITATPAPPPPTTLTITPTGPVAYSGIYPHTAVTNTHNEVGIGGIIKRGNDLFYMTYGPHVTTGGSDRLYSVNTTDMSHTTYLEYPGNTDANRYRDTNLGIDVIGAAYIDNSDVVCFLPVSNPGELRGRITGTAAHLTDSNKLYYMTMEEGLYEVDFSDLDNPVITTLRVDGNNSGGGGSKNLPGVHGKGLFTGQGHLYYTNNGQGEGYGGGLVEWDGTGDPEQQSSWTFVDTNAQYTEVTSKRGPEDMDPSSLDAIWATGWDGASTFINTRDATSGQWTKFRFPQGSYTHGYPNGWYTEWPRIRDVGLAGGYLMSHHGMMFLVPDTFSTQDYGGLTPLVTHHKMITDYVEDGDQIAFTANDSSKFNNGLVPKANSNIMFLDKADLPEYGGTPNGYGGVWLNDGLNNNELSDAFLISGFEGRVIHIEHENTNSANFEIQLDTNGDGTWTTLDTVAIEGTSGKGYGYYMIPESVDAQWLRVQAKDNITSATVYLHQTNARRLKDDARLASLADPDTPTARSQGFLRSTNESDFKLEFAADRLDAAGNVIGTGYYRGQLNPTTYQLELVAVSDAAAEADVRADAATSQDFGVDSASVFIDDGGTRYRLPKGDSIFDTATDSGWRRGKREVVTERSLMNIHGTFYELPRNFDGGGIERIIPITTHNLDIFDYNSWRGMLVLSGVTDGGAADGHYVESDDGNVGLWFGNVDDLYRFGAPVGEGGPWNGTAVTAGVASDPYLMTGYQHKLMELSHDENQDVTFTVEVDFLGTGQWEVFDNFIVGDGETFAYNFPDGYSAHWVRLISDTSTNATAWFTYTADVALAGDLDGDGFVGLSDLDIILNNWNQNVPPGNPLADPTGDGFVGLADLDIVLNNWNAGTPPIAQTNIPEPASYTVLCLFVAALARSRRLG